MGPDYNHPALPYHDNYHSHDDDDVVMPDIGHQHTHSATYPVYHSQQSSSFHVPFNSSGQASHTAYPYSSHHHHNPYPSSTAYNDDDDDDDDDELEHDGGATLNAIHTTLDLLLPTGNVSSMQYDSDADSDSDSDSTHPHQDEDLLGPSDDAASVENTSSSSASYLAALAAPNQTTPHSGITQHGPVSFAAGSWPNTTQGSSVVAFAVQSVNPTSNAVSYQLQGLQALQSVQADDDEDTLPAPLPPYDPHGFTTSNPNPFSLGPENPQLFNFLYRWAYSRLGRYPACRNGTPHLPALDRQATQPERTVRHSDLDGDHCDFQGLDWEDMGTTRFNAREYRKRSYKNYVNCHGSDEYQYDFPDVRLPMTDSFFRFRRMDIKKNVHLAHFQLRNTLSCVSRSQAFYPSKQAIHLINPITGTTNVAMDLEDISGVQISTLSAKHGMLIAGGFNGEYCMKHLDSMEDSGYHEGQLTTNPSGITNHVQVHLSRTSGRPLASFASNDSGFRTLDLATETIVSETTFQNPLNCSAISPDRRLRVMVGDSKSVLICNAETNDVLHELVDHRDFGFACDWSDNGYTVATGFQDMTVKIWDARKWTDTRGRPIPICTIRSEMAGARSLRFSSVGTGKPILVAAEEADFINIIDAQTFTSKQTIDIFGEIGGVDFADDERNLLVLCSDRDRGGLLQFERCRPTFDQPDQILDDLEGRSYPRPPYYSRRRRRRAPCLDEFDLL